MSFPVRKSLFVGIAGMSLIGTVAGCAPSAQAPAAQSAAATTGSAPIAGTGASSPGATG
jgi:hypothetical protein